jgi:hypothetical protein
MENDWYMFVEPGLLKSSQDTVNTTLNKERESLQQTAIGKEIEQWYSDIKANNGIPKALLNYPREVSGMFAISRKMIEAGGSLSADDLSQIANGMKLVDKEISPAPPGLIDEILKRLNASIGMNWSELMQNLKK